MLGSSPNIMGVGTALPARGRCGLFGFSNLGTSAVLTMYSQVVASKGLVSSIQVEATTTMDRSGTTSTTWPPKPIAAKAGWLPADVTHHWYP